MRASSVDMRCTPLEAAPDPVPSSDAVVGAVRDCWASLYSPTAVSYRAKFGHADDLPAMGVAVQAMVDAEVSGVMFTCSPTSGDRSVVVPLGDKPGECKVIHFIAL